MTSAARMRGFLVVLLLGSSTSLEAEPDRAGFLAMLHDGRFGVATEALRRPGTSSSPESLFFDAFTTYWRLVFDEDNPDLRVRLEKQLDDAVEAAERASRSGAAVDASLWGGSSHLLLAELRADQHRPLAAAFEAKKAKRLLESPTLAGADLTDAQFGLGTYNYVADVVPSYVKGLRALLFLPKGNRDKGLRQLEGAAVGSRFFSQEARILLITIYTNKHERLYARALEQRDRLLQASPTSISASYAAALLDLSLGENEAALARLVQAGQRAATFGDVDPVVLRCIDLLRARAELAALRPDLAGKTAERALASGQGLDGKIRNDLSAVQQTASRQAAGIPWATVVAAGTGDEQAAHLRTLAAAHPERPLLSLLAGDAELRAGRPREASSWLDRAQAAGLPQEFAAACRFRLGQAADLLGERARAVALYASVANMPGFVAKDAAFYFQQVPYGASR